MAEKSIDATSSSASTAVPKRGRARPGMAWAFLFLGTSLASTAARSLRFWCGSGMGDVYLAQDTKLDRKIALKVLPPELAENEERRARFQREAKAIALLDHPNVVQVFSVEGADGPHFITMQLVQGKTLAELLPKNGLSLDEFFDSAPPFAHG